MADMTAQEVITASYRKCGVKSPSTQQLTDGLQDLQNMLSSWSADGLIVPYSVTESFTLTVGQAVYTIGVTGDSPDLTTSTGRPVKITSAFIRISNVDYPINTDMTKREYNALSSKDTEGRPNELYYDPQYPLGKIKFNYEADSAYTFHLVSEKVLVNPTAQGTTFSIPLEYNRAMVYNLAIELAVDNDIQLSAEVFNIANRSYGIIENINALDQLISGVGVDSAILSAGTGSMDINRGDY